MMEKDDPMAKGMGQIKKSAMQAQKLVRRIIDLHREKPASRTIHDLRLLLKDQMDLVDIIIPRSARVTTNFGTNSIPAFIEETGFRQVILNLVINARDAIDRTGKIQISLKKVSTGDSIMKGAIGKKTIAPVDGAELALSDNGKGIPEEIQGKLFDPFVTTKASGSGSGFGLYNTKVFIEDHNGLIGFATKKDEGTTFFLFIPLETDEEEGSVNYLKSTKRATRAFVKTKKI